MSSPTPPSDLLIDGPPSAPMTICLAHGAGAGMETDFMVAMSQGLAGRGLRVVRFEFPYMQQRRVSGRQSPPDREQVLRQFWLQVIDSLGAQPLLIGGKSMGGRIASLIADEAGVAGLVCLGYPFHPAGKPQQLRIEHLRTLRTPTLIVQGTRDALGNQHEVGSYELSPSIHLHWLPDGDHSFKPRKASGRTQEENWREAVDAVARFALSLVKTQ